MPSRPSTAHVDVLLARRRPVPAEQGAHRGGVLPHLQRALRHRQPARPHLRPTATRHGRARGPPARALRVRPRGRPRRSRPRHPPHDPAHARAPRRGQPPIPDEALELIADRVTDNVRALEGALIRIVAFHSLSRRPLDVDLAAEVLDSLYPVVHAPAAFGRRGPARDVQGLRRLASRISSPPAGSGRSPVPARSPCSSRASSRPNPFRPSAAPSAAATIPPSCTPAGERRHASPTMPRPHASSPTSPPSWPAR